jgi:hypothetical protein
MVYFTISLWYRHYRLLFSDFEIFKAYHVRARSRERTSLIYGEISESLSQPACHSFHHETLRCIAIAIGKQ